MNGFDSGVCEPQKGPVRRRANAMGDELSPIVSRDSNWLG